MRSADPFPAGLLEKARNIVRQRTGLVFTEPRASALNAGLAAGLHGSGSSSAEEYVERLGRESKLLDDLAARITVGETYFFRDPTQFSFIRDQILPGIEAQPDPKRVLRVWSAGCATGEEAYSLAITLRECGRPARILGTDISRRALTGARRAVYRDWSLRAVPDDVVRRYFRRGRGRYELDRAVRDAVEFQYLNLAGDAYPSPALGIAHMDVILCRNVLIYFDRATSERVAARLIASLGPDGWLITGASDPPLQDLVDCELVVTDSGRAYRQPNRASRPEPVAGRRPVDSHFGWTDPVARPAVRPSSRAATELRPGAGAQRPAPRTRRSDSSTAAVAPVGAVAAAPAGAAAGAGVIAKLYEMRRYEEVARVAAGHVERESGDITVWILLVRAHANRGRLRTALAACLAALEVHPLHAELAYLHAVLMVEAGHDADAARAFRRALYLDRQLIVAHLGLGTVLARSGQADAGRRALAAAEQLLAVLPGDHLVAGADGETAGRLLAMIRNQLACANG